MKRINRTESKLKRYELIKWLRIMRGINLSYEDIKVKCKDLGISQFIMYHLEKLNLISYDNDRLYIRLTTHSDDEIYKMLKKSETEYNKEYREKRKRSNNKLQDNSIIEQLQSLHEKVDKLLKYLNIQ